MAMTTRSGDGKRPQPVLNVTPLVDVVLVLLIIFIVITPQLSKRFWVHVPKQEKQEIERRLLQDEPSPPLILRVGDDRGLTINGTQVGFEELPERLRRMFAARDDHVLFFDAGDEVDYGFAVEVMDQARAGGAVTIATLMDAVETTLPAAAGPPP